MSQYKKKKMKQPTRLRTLVASLMLIAPALHAANNTEFSQRPLVGVAASFAPHIALALSVEFPTAGAAYPDKNILTVNGNTSASPMTETYLGYFDNQKCYKYNHEDGYFEPSSMAENTGGYYGLCNAGNETEEFSGNLLNFMTMTAIDIFRSAMTGGNRAMGTGIDANSYTSADTPSATFLRRANVFKGQNGLGTYRIRDRQFNALNATANGTLATVKRTMPHYFIDVLMKDTIANQYAEGKGGSTQDNSNGAFGKPREMGFRSITGTDASTGQPIKATRFVFPNNDNPRYTASQQPGTLAGTADRFADQRLHFYNDGFTVHIGRKVATAINVGNTYMSPAVTSATQLYAMYGNDVEYYAVIDENFSGLESKYRDSAKKWAKPLNVVVKVCDASKGLEENCQPYGSNYKPEGLLQSYTKSSGMRFATLGYLNIAGNGVNGGVLRSRMKTLIGDKKQDGETYSTVYGDEWNANTGVFALNPDTTDAQRSGVANSGTINYLNKFGDRSGYKTNDPAGELYETALTYLMGTNADINSNKAIYQTNLTDAAKDAFPVIYNWDDPYKRGIEQKAQHCHANNIIFIGDTNTHHDGNVLDKQPQAREYLRYLFSNEPTLRYLASGSTEGGLSRNFGSFANGSKDATGKILQVADPGYGNSPAYLAGLAFWARTNNIREDLTTNNPLFQGTGQKVRPINSGNFMIDVMDSNDYKVTNKYLDQYDRNSNTAYYMGNSYYLAAKYGGFTLRESSLDTDLTPNNISAANKPLPLNRASWTDDKQGETSITQFRDGVPRNFALANNPKAMKAALDKAFASSAALSNPSQAATGLSTGLGDIVDVSETGSDYLLQSTYDFADLTGDVVIMKPVLQNGEINLTPTKYIGQILTAQYHGNTFATRKVFTVDKNNQAFDFTNGNASDIFDAQAVNASGAPSADKLRDYILGDNSLENGTLRQRKGLLGTVINSTATPILKAKQLSSCNTQFSDAALNRPVYYTAAANDGMLHIFDEEGQEQMAYMARSALSKLPAFAKIGYQHQYLNDGTPVIQDVCLNDVAQTVLIGTTGRGGNAVYALNVTDISNPSTSNVMWELTDSDLGLTVSKPVITKGADGKQYAIVSSGFHTDGKASDNGYIFIVDIATGSYSKVKLGTAGVGAPFVYDGENDGIGDKIFVGDSDGKLWQLDSTGDAARPFAIPAKYNGQPLFTPYSSNARPITGAPYAEMVNGKLMVVAATGRYFSEKDLSTTQENYAYGLIADKAAIVDTNNDSEILQQEILADITSTTDLDPSEKRVYSVTKNQMTDSHKGWRLKLLTGANVSADSLVRQRQVATFAYSRNTGDISATCVRGANSGLVQVDVRNGGLFPKALVDTNKDGRFDENDSPNVGMTENIGVNTPSVSFFKYRDEDGKVQSVALSKSGLSKGEEAWERLRNLEAQAGVRRISWREIF